MNRITLTLGLSGGLTALVLFAAIPVMAALYGCATCGTFREPSAVVAEPYQLADLCFKTHGDLAAAVATGHLDPSKITTHSVCATSAQPYPAGAVCPKK